MSLVKKLLITAFTLIIIGVIGSLVTFQPFMNAEKSVTTEQLIKESFKDIDINVNNMAIKLYDTEEKETKVITSGMQESKTKVSVDNDILKVKINERKPFQITFPGIKFSKEIPTIAIYLPTEKYNRITVKSENGMITAQNMNADDISIRTINGLVSLESIQTKTTKITTENGKIDLKNITGNLKSESTNGMISYEAEQINQNIEFRTVNGLISIETEEKPTNVTFDLSVELGKIDVFGSSDTNIVYGEGENRVKLMTSLGKIKVN